MFNQSHRRLEFRFLSCSFKAESFTTNCSVLPATGKTAKVFLLPYLLSISTVLLQDKTKSYFTFVIAKSLNEIAFLNITYASLSANAGIRK